MEIPGGGRIKDLTLALPEDLVPLKGIKGCTLKLDYRAAEAYEAMVKQARKDGIKAPIFELRDGYRPDTLQQRFYINRIRYLLNEGHSLSAAKLKAQKWVAPPGTSAHRTGRAVDLIMSSNYPSRLKKAPEYLWLRANAVKYGFYNYEVEPWHWEYNPPQYKQDHNTETYRKETNIRHGTSYTM